MKKIAIFTEGQGELIFVRNLLPRVLGYENLKIECFELHSDQFRKTPYPIYHPDPLFHFLIVNVANDARVITAIREREQGLWKQGYEAIIGLRDMYSAAYRTLASEIDDSVTNKFIQGHEEAIIQTMVKPEKIQVYFAIMEFEAWLLAMYSLFAKIDPDLTVDFIAEKLDFNLKKISPQTEFFHPTNVVERIFRLVGKTYAKSRDEMESISNMIDDQDIRHALETGKCDSFASFWNRLNSLRNEN